VPYLRRKFKFYVTFRVLGGNQPFRFAKEKSLQEITPGLVCHYVRNYKLRVRFRGDGLREAHVVFAALGQCKVLKVVFLHDAALFSFQSTLNLTL